MTLREIETALRKKLEADQTQDRLGNRIHNTIAEVLKSFEGKKLTKRFTDKATAAITALFPGQHPCVSWEHSGKCSVWVHDTIPFNDRLIFYVAPTYAPTEPAYQGHWIGECHAAGFEREDLCHGEAAVERIAQREALISSPSLCTLARKIQAARFAWEELGALIELDHFDTLRYEAKRLAGLKEEWRGGR